MSDLINEFVRWWMKFRVAGGVVLVLILVVILIFIVPYAVSWLFKFIRDEIKDRRARRERRRKEKEQRDSERILVSAVCYALTLRRHYTIEDTVGYVRDRLPELSDWCRRTIARAIEEQIRLFRENTDPSLGEDRFVGGGVQYQAMWEKLLEELLSR